MSQDPRFVALFDIDGTLVTGPHGRTTAGAISIRRAARELAGSEPDVHVREFAGRTDPQIARMLLESAGERDPAPERVLELVRRYVDHLRYEVAGRPYRALGDPEGAVASVRGRGGVVGLGTGNVRDGGAIKLQSAGIAALFDGMCGGFGEDGQTRAELLAAGARSCDPSGGLPVVVIGDTPRDVEAGREIGALTVGVPYRDNTREVLEHSGADAIVEAVDATLGDVVDRLLPRA